MPALMRLADALPQQTLALRERAAVVIAAIADHLREHRRRRTIR